MADDQGNLEIIARSERPIGFSERLWNGVKRTFVKGAVDGAIGAGIGAATGAIAGGVAGSLFSDSIKEAAIERIKDDPSRAASAALVRRIETTDLAVGLAKSGAVLGGTLVGAASVLTGAVKGGVSGVVQGKETQEKNMGRTNWQDLVDAQAVMAGIEQGPKR